jgi:hypothetical protein
MDELETIAYGSVQRLAASLGFRHATVNDLSNVCHAKQFGKQEKEEEDEEN